ncbi:hypothetical protein F4604DRAFT_1588702, partial [Suillus subluteus]
FIPTAIMDFDAHTYHLQHSTLNNYLASSQFANCAIWQHSTTGLEVVNELDLLPMVCTIVGRVSPYCLKCTPSGNHFAGGASPLTKAKYQFNITRPAHHELVADFLAGVHNLKALQEEVGKTGNYRNMVTDDYTGKML